MAKRILIAAPVHQDEKVFIEYLKSLTSLIIPENYEINYFFILHNSPELKKYLAPELYSEINNDINIYKEENKPKIWTKENFEILSNMRTTLLTKAREEKYDYLFTVDSDILLHPRTLSLLLKDNKDIVGNLLWTKMNNKITPICGKDEEWGAYPDESFLLTKGVFPIGWTCACVLISSKIFNNKNISYYPIPGIDNTGCEDYVFCLRIKCNFPDTKIWIDTRLPARHLYHEKDYQRWIKEKKLLKIYE